jgi:sulfur-oxidizing protein SoxA
MRWLLVLVMFVSPAQAGAQSPVSPAQAGAQFPRSGISFQSADVRALQADDFANPGMLWVTRGEAMWGQSCRSCHGEAARSMRGVAASYPKHAPDLGGVVNLEQRINACVTRNAKQPPLAWESEGLLGLTAFVARQSHGLPLSVKAEGPAAPVLERGRSLYFERQGQLHLSCTQCHDANWGRTLLAEKISQGHPVDWPAYRLEWQSLGSLQRRLRACYFGVRAELPAFGSPDLVALELYLAVRSAGLPIAGPGVRR